MSELRECPFCGSHDEKPINHAEDCFIRMYAENVDEYYYSEMLVHDRESMKEAWNTRAERTCHVVYHEGAPACSECLRELTYESRFCDRCGARVTEDTE